MWNIKEKEQIKPHQNKPLKYAELRLPEGIGKEPSGLWWRIMGGFFGGGHGVIKCGCDPNL